jgi:hypothetical protein
MIRICNGGHRRHIGVPKTAESSEFTIQSDSAVEKLGLLGRCPDVCVFHLECNFTSEG